MKFKIVESVNLADLDYGKVFVNAGRAYEKGIKEENVDAKELEMGIAVEKEHTSNLDVAKRIALDHLAELKDYYTRLAKMEEEGKKAGNAPKGENDDAGKTENDKDKDSDEVDDEDSEEDEEGEKSAASMKV
jgi:hypothetical protein